MRGIRVLVVDDELAVRLAIQMLLSRAGCVVETAGSGDEALDKFNSSQFDIVFTDLRMPGLNGDELARELKARRSDLPIVLVTGDPPVPPPGVVNVVLRKPFCARDVIDLALSLTQSSEQDKEEGREASKEESGNSDQIALSPGHFWR